MFQLLKSSFSPFGRCNRSGLLRLTCALIAVQIFAGVLIWAAGLEFTGPAVWVLKTAFVWLGFCAIAKRLHDIGYSAWWIPGFIVALTIWSFVQTTALFWAVGPAMMDIHGWMFWLSFAGLMFPLVVLAVRIHYARGCPHTNRHGPRPGETGVSYPETKDASDVGDIANSTA